MTPQAIMSSVNADILGNSEGFIWDESNGMRVLQEMLVNDLGLDLSGWAGLSPTGISDDGLTIVGTGINPNGDTEAFIATVPEPGTLALFAIGVSALLRRRVEPINKLNTRKESP